MNLRKQTNKSRFNNHLNQQTLADLGGDIKSENLVDFIDSGRNVLIAANEKLSNTLRDVANECGVDFDDGDVSDAATVVVVVTMSLIPTNTTNTPNTPSVSRD